MNPDARPPGPQGNSDFLAQGLQPGGVVERKQFVWEESNILKPLLEKFKYQLGRRGV